MSSLRFFLLRGVWIAWRGFCRWRVADSGDSQPPMHSFLFYLELSQLLYTINCVEKGNSYEPKQIALENYVDSGDLQSASKLRY